METHSKSWKLQTLSINNKIKDAIQQQHHAAKLIALVGRYLIPRKADDSNTNMEFVIGKNMLLGNIMPSGLRVALSIDDLKLSILDKENNIIKEIILDGKTMQQSFDELKKSLHNLGVDVSNFTNELHFKIPMHQLDEGGVFSAKNKDEFIENANYRHNAKIVLNEVAKQIDKNELIRVWPHHFDTGAYFVINKNKKGNAASTIGIGLAIPDLMIDEPYYYLSFWSEISIKGIKNIRQLNVGKWMMPNWDGAVLKLSEVQQYKTAKQQFEIVESFFNQGIQLLLSRLNNN